MRAIKAEFFLAFAVLGSLLPYLPVYLEQRGLSDAQIGWVLSAGGFAVLLTPVLVTLLADTHLQNRTLLACSFAAASVALGLLWWAGDFWPIFLAHAAFALAFAAVVPIQDGLYFAMQRQRLAAGLPTVPYHRVRVHGTVGFIVPSLVLYVWLAAGAPVGVSLAAAIVSSLLALANTPLLAPSRIETDGRAGPGTRLPTLHAFRALASGPVLLFCIACWIVQLAIAGYYAFYPIYLTRGLGVDEKWIGLISNLGVLVEVFFMLGFGWLERRLGLRALLGLGGACMALRFTLLWLFPNVWVAVLTQGFHGMMVIVVYLVPPIYLDRQAGDAFRNSIQGLYAMLIVGSGRIVGNAIAGYVADYSLTGVFGYSAALSVAVMALFVLGFRDRKFTTENTQGTGKTGGIEPGQPSSPPP